MMRIKLACIGLLFGTLAGCASAPDYSYISAQLDMKTEYQIAVYRDTGFLSPMAGISVEINGASVGKVSNKGVLFAKSQEGTNGIRVGFSGLQGAAVKKAGLFYEAEPDEGNYFIISQTSGVLTEELRVMEVTKSSFLAQIQ